MNSKNSSAICWKRKKSPSLGIFSLWSQEIDPFAPTQFSAGRVVILMGGSLCF